MHFYCYHVCVCVCVYISKCLCAEWTLFTFLACWSHTLFNSV